MLSSLSPARRSWLTGLLLFAATALWFARSVGCDFVNYDDAGHVYDNRHVQAGLTGETLRWVVAGNEVIWNPLTRLSHAVDGHLFGQRAWGHHLTSVLLHAVNAVLAWLVVRRFTGWQWGAVAVAALWAWHPLRVESVTWVSERKDVLSGLFFLLTLLAYGGYVERRRAGTPGAGRRYALMLAAAAASLLSKPMAVTLPALLLVLDAWPLGRLTAGLRPAAGEHWRGLLLEKLPLVAGAAAISLVTMRTQAANGAFVLELSWAERLANAPVAVARYLGKFAWPFDLVVAYPHPGHWPVWAVAGSLGLAAALSAAAWRLRHRRPVVLAGWLWFLGMLVPVIGLVQVGFQSIADRYTYLPMLGLTWAAGALAGAVPGRAVWRAAAAALVLAGLGARTIHQQGHWRDSLALYRHALDVSPDNPQAHAFLGYTLLSANRTAEAEPHALRALEILPRNPLALTTLAAIRARQGRMDEAAAAYEGVLAVSPGDMDASYALAMLRLGQQRPDEALALLAEAIRRHPDNFELLFSTAEIEAAAGRFESALQRCAAGLARWPDAAPAHTRAAGVYLQAGQVDEALRAAARAVELAPAAPLARAAYGDLLRLAGRRTEAMEQYRAGLAASPDDAGLRVALGMVLGEEGDLDGAQREFETVLRARADHAPALAELGYVLLARERPADAAGRFRSALAADARSLRALTGLTRAALLTGAAAEAAATAEQAVRVYPNRADTRLMWAEVLARQGRFADALAQYDEAAQREPANAAVHAGRGYVLLLLRRPAEARRAWEEALRLNPDFPQLRERLQQLPR